jgi:hypothetical protein
MTLSRSRMTCQACGASLSLDHGGSAASRPEDHGILSVIAEGDLPKFITDPDEGPPTYSSIREEITFHIIPQHWM